MPALTGYGWITLTVQALILAHRHSNPGAANQSSSWVSGCRPFLNLLGDESNAVRVQVMASLVQTLDQFCIANEEARNRAFADFLPALLAADAGCGYCWRIHHHLMLALPHFVHMFTSDEVCPLSPQADLAVLLLERTCVQVLALLSSCLSTCSPEVNVLFITTCWL